ncbi:hypothetical protein BDV29DRAFT_152996 [Aspergillus leporis]|jgi:hypothetical protein|uniref:Uncharacterized protein n=1 Tax=Aspergillus leporis TaxID=41062 RepID=A0A5N5XBY2_9EURO|nr:hypothetical protein BDV29DRAFT_152996 [Aspergillus leporis]
MRSLTLTLIFLITLVTSVTTPAKIQGENDLSDSGQGKLHVYALQHTSNNLTISTSQEHPSIHPAPSLKLNKTPDFVPMLAATPAPVTTESASLPKNLPLKTKRRSDKTLDVAPTPNVTRVHATTGSASLPASLLLAKFWRLDKTLDVVPMLTVTRAPATMAYALLPTSETSMPRGRAGVPW